MPCPGGECNALCVVFVAVRVCCRCGRERFSAQNWPCTAPRSSVGIGIGTGSEAGTTDVCPQPFSLSLSFFPSFLHITCPSAQRYGQPSEDAMHSHLPDLDEVRPSTDPFQETKAPAAALLSLVAGRLVPQITPCQSWFCLAPRPGFSARAGKKRATPTDKYVHAWPS